MCQVNDLFVDANLGVVLADLTHQGRQTMSWGTTEAAALAYAATLDRAFAADPDEALEEALLSIGELLGGLSCKGYAADLRAHLDRVEEDLVMDASPRDYSPGMGGNDPDAVCSSRLADAIDRAREADCRDWLASAQAVIARHTPAALAVAA